MITAPATLEEIRNDGDGATFPCDALAGSHTALVLFAAGFFGRQDAFWIAEALMHATCVDIDHERLDAMAAVYPTDWDFLEANVYEWAPGQTGQWDVVSVDCPSGHFDQCADLLPVWCRLARRLVVLGAGRGQEFVQPSGWEVTDVRRRSSYGGGVYWAVLEPA